MMPHNRKRPYPPSPPSTSRSPFPMRPPTTTLPLATGLNGAWFDPYFLGNWGGDGGSSSYLEMLCGFKPRPPLDLMMAKQSQYLPSVSRNPITSVTPSVTNNQNVTITTEQGIEYELRKGSYVDLTMDNKRLKRILSNRISAQKSRLKKAQYIDNMEKKAVVLEKEVEKLKSCIKSQEDCKKLLQTENFALQEQIIGYEGEAKLLEAMNDRNLEEMHRLRELAEAMKRGGMHLAPSTSFVEERRANEDAHGFDGYRALINYLEQDDMDPDLAFPTLAFDPPKSLI